LLVLIVLPLAAIGLLNWIYRKRGGVGQGWGGALLVSLLVILRKLWA